MKRVIITTFYLFGYLIYAMAQNPAELAASVAVKETQDVKTEVMEYPEQTLIKSMTSSLSKQGKSLGVINGDGSIYVVGAATTARPSNMPGFISSRNIAFSIAEMTAKMNLLRLAGEQITSGRGFQMLEDIIEGSDPDAAGKASLIQKAEKLADVSLDKALAEMGVSNEEIQQMNTDKKKAVYEQNFHQTVRSLVSGMIQGCAVVRIAEGESGGDDYQIAVCIKYSPEFHSFASLIKNRGNGNIPLSGAKSSRDKILAMSEADLVNKLGVWVSYNQQGEMVIYGFGQQEVREVGSRQSAAYSRAYSQARLQAINNIKNFVAEDMIATEAMESIEKLEEYADGSNEYFSRNKWQQAVASKSTTLNIATEQVRQWQGVHTTSKTNVAGYVVAWTYANAKRANALNSHIHNTKPSVSNSIPSNTTVRQQTVKGAITITGDDEDL